MSSYNYPPQGSGSGGGVTSINGDTTSAQIITGGTGISVSTAGGTTTITNTESPGSGTVTSVSVTTANGVSGTVANPTTTPAISLTLGAITPSSVGASGTVTGSNLSGSNSGDVTLGTADGLSLTGQVLSLGTASTSTTGALTSADWNTFNGKTSGGITSLTGDVTASGPGAAAATLAATTNATLTTLSGLTTASSLSTVGTIGTGTWHGTAVAPQYGGTGLNTSASTGFPSISSGTWSILTATQLTADLNLFTTALQGLAPASGGGTTNYLRADGTWAAPPGTAGANTTLSNLGTTSINASLIPNAFNTLNLGSASTGTWLGVYCENLYALNISNYYSAGINLGNTSSSCYLYDENGVNQLQWGSGGITLSQQLTWSGVYLGASAVVKTVSLGVAGTVWTSTGSTSAPVWSVPSLGYYSGGMPTGTTWATSSSSFGAPTTLGTNTLTKIYGNLTVSAGSGSTPAITFTPPTATAAYIVSAAFTIQQSSTDAGAMRLTDGTTPFAFGEFESPNDTTNCVFPVLLSGLYNPGVTSAVTVTLQVLANSGVGSTIVNGLGIAGVPSILWTVTQIAA